MDDMISRQAVLKLLSTMPPEEATTKAMLIQSVKQMDAAQSERKRGKWINGTCNQCGSHAPYWAMATTYYRSNFCPNCGADMREVSE